MEKLKGMSEWIGQRQVQSLASSGFVIVNKSFENTVGVGRDEIEDDSYGVFNPLMGELGRSAAEFPDELVWPLLNAGLTTECYDGQYFFDTDHPVLDADGVEQSVSNFGGGSGTPWFLLDVTRAIKPFIFQSRRPAQFVAKDNPQDERVFMNKEFTYGVDMRCNAGYGLWQLAYASKQTLNAENYAAARAAMMSMKGDYGRQLRIRPTLLVVPPSLESKALEVLKAERDAAGATNVYMNTAQWHVEPLLAA
jgi:phage major head subunit gpT-like protein